MNGKSFAHFSGEDFVKMAFQSGLLAPDTQIYDAFIQGAILGRAVANGTTLSEEAQIIADQYGDEDDEQFEPQREQFEFMRDHVRMLVTDPRSPIHVTTLTEDDEGNVVIDDGGVDLDELPSELRDRIAPYIASRDGEVTAPLSESDVREPSDDELSAWLTEPPAVDGELDQ